MRSQRSTAERVLEATPKIVLILEGIALVLAALWVTGIATLWRLLLDLTP